MPKSAMLVLGVVAVVVLALIVEARSVDVAGTASVRYDRSPSHSKIFAPGQIEGLTPEIELRPQINGRVAKLFVEEGQTVLQGQVLLQLENDIHRQEVAFASSDLRLSEAERERLQNGAQQEELAEVESLYRAKLAQLEQAQRTWARTQRLLDEGAVTQQLADDQVGNVERLTSEVVAAKARVQLLRAPARADELRIASAKIDAARARWELAQTRLRQTELRSPIDGQVLKIDVQLGELAGPDSPRPSIVLADTSRFQVRAYVEELDAPRVCVGMSAVIVADGLPGTTIKGRVRQLSPHMEHKTLWSNRPGERFDTRTREVLIELADHPALVFGLRVDVTIDASMAVDRTNKNLSRTPPAANHGQ